MGPSFDTWKRQSNLAAFSMSMLVTEKQPQLWPVSAENFGVQRAALAKAKWVHCIVQNLEIVCRKETSP